MRRVLLVLLLVAVAVPIGRGQVPCELLPVQPSCEVAVLPGPTANTLEIVKIDGEQVYDSTGQLRLTTVAVDSELGAIEWLRARLSGTSDVMDREVLFPEGSTEDDVAEQNELLMSASQTDATIAGLVAAGYEADDLYAGARIVEITEDSAEGTEALSPDDVVVAVDGTDVRNAREAVDAVAQHAPGDEVVLTLEGGREVVLTAAEHPEDPSRAFLGLLLEDALDLPFEVEIDAGNIGGPSAGLMFALGIVDLLGPDDLTGGATVAGTGVITPDGEVRAIGGIRQKVYGATAPREEGDDPAVAFLVPAGNMAEARTASVADDILLVPVATIQEAVEALRDLARGAEPAGAVALGP